MSKVGHMNPKKCIATYTNYILKLKTALHSSDLVIKLFLTVVKRYFKPNLLL